MNNNYKNIKEWSELTSGVNNDDCEVEQKYYYEVHIFFGRNNGYSSFFESEKYLDDEDEIIEEAIIIIPEIKNDVDMCDYAQEITRKEYKEFTSK